LKVTDPGAEPNPVPVIVTVVPVMLDPGEMLLMTGVGVKAIPLLD